MKSDYWNVTNEQVIEKTGKPLAHWTCVLKEFGAADKKPAECVAHLNLTSAALSCRLALSRLSTVTSSSGL